MAEGVLRDPATEANARHVNVRTVDARSDQLATEGSAPGTDGVKGAVIAKTTLRESEWAHRRAPLMSPTGPLPARSLL
jgi:hypothetical protein